MKVAAAGTTKLITYYKLHGEVRSVQSPLQLAPPRSSKHKQVRGGIYVSFTTELNHQQQTSLLQLLYPPPSRSTVMPIRDLFTVL